jgi:hypothetical protein
VFSEAERRAAVADYASRLGLAQPGKAVHVATCPKAVAPVSASHGARHETQTASSGGGPILVRTSVVHAIDASAPVAAPIAAPAAGLAWTMAAHPIQASAEQTAPAGQGASECLSVESDGVNLGFRNQCGYGVQFAYCLQKASDPAAACDAGGRTGAVAANAFAMVLQDTGIKSAEAEHDFRWVACSGNTNDVVAHLDRADPPAGRCVKANAS